MFLAVDIGNTNIVFGVYESNKWVCNWRIQTDRNRTPDEYAVLFRDFLSEADLKLKDFDRAAVSSVVPSLTRGISEILTQRTGKPTFVLRYGVNMGIEIRTEQPERLGADLIADGVAAYALFQSNCLVVDLGTATKVNAIAEPGVFLGTAIAVGLNVSLDALVGRTAQLPQVELAPPPSVIGRNTIHAMQSGLVIGHVCMIEGLIERMRQELGGAKVVATGGLASLIAPHTSYFDVVDPLLTLEGLRLIAEMN